MGFSLEQVLDQVNHGDTVTVTMVSNQDNGIASYAVGGLIYHQPTGGVDIGGAPFQPATLRSDPAKPLKMYFSDRKLDIDGPPAVGTFPHSPRQPFNANATEQLSMVISLRPGFQGMHLTVFGSTSLVTMEPMGDLLVGLGPSLGNSRGGVFIVSFLGIQRPF